MKKLFNSLLVSVKRRLRWLTLMLIVLVISPVYSQPLSLVFEKELPEEFLDYFASAQRREFYFSPDGSRLFINTETGYSVLDMKSGGELLSTGKNVEKVSDMTASVAGVLSNKSLNREDAVDAIKMDEGTEFMAFPENNLLIILDWNLDRNIVKAIDLKTGDMIWETDKYRYSASKESQFAAIALSLAGEAISSSLPSSGMMAASSSLAGIGESVMLSGYASLGAGGFITPMDNTTKFLLKSSEGLVCLDLLTGEEHWIFTEPINIGYHTMHDDGIVLINFNASYFKSGEKKIIKLDVETGSKQWSAAHLSDFRVDRTYVSGDRLICDYYGAEVFDLNSGKRVLLSIDERTVKTQNTMSTMFMSEDGQRSQTAIASPSIVHGDHLYTSTFKMGRVFANDGSSKAMVQKYDLKTGDQIWETGKLAKGVDLDYVSDEHVFVRKGKAFGNSSLIIIDGGSGKVLAELDDVDGSVYAEPIPDILTDQNLYRIGKKSIYAFNTSDWKLSEEFELKKSGIGKIRSVIPAGNELAVIGDGGLTFLDPQSGDAPTIPFNDIRSVYWNDKLCYVMDKAGTHAITLHDRQLKTSIEQSIAGGDLFLFTPEGEELALVENEFNNTSQKHLLVFQNQ